MASHPLRLTLSFICCIVFGSSLANAQGAPLSVGPLTVSVPQGWLGQANAVPVRIFSPDSTPLQNFSVEFFPPEQTPQDLAGHHAMIWGRMGSAFHITAAPRSGVLGQFVWTRAEVAHAFGQKETFILYSTKSGETYVGVAVHGSRADLVSRNLPAVENMLRNAALGDSQPPASTPSYAGGSLSTNAPAIGSPASLRDYVYTAPPGWTTNQYPDGIVLTSPVFNTGERCLLSLWPMRGSSSGGNLQRDANLIFQDIFRTYELSSHTAYSEVPSSFTRGASGQGWDYLIVKRGIRKPGGQYETLLGFVFLARLENRLAVISGISKEPLVSSCMGELVNNVWPQFFYSLSFRNWTPKPDASAMRGRLAGKWTAATATAADQFTFAGNGRYASAAAAQQYAVLSSSELLETTQAYFGNGSYTIQGNAITLTQDDRKGQPEHGFFRVEEESKDEGRNWTPSLYLLRTSTVDGKEYELRYFKK
ncbi:MAG TPA: hypothetical protein VFW31_00750 [Candidatus Angelobacter sp.]|nr:hypothetical protein [Candidatus Angelobacter sp.]